MKWFETKVRYYDATHPMSYQRTVAVRVWKLFGFVIWSRREG